MLGEEDPNWDGGDEEAEDAGCCADLVGEGGVCFVEAGEEGWSFVVGGVAGGVVGGVFGVCGGG